MADIAYSDFVTSTGTDTSNGTGSSVVASGVLTLNATITGERGQRRLPALRSTMADGDVFLIEAIVLGGNSFTSLQFLHFTAGALDFRPSLGWVGTRWLAGYCNRLTPGDIAGGTFAPADSKPVAQLRRSGNTLIAESAATRAGPFTPFATLQSTDGYWDFADWSITQVVLSADNRGSVVAHQFEQVGTVAPAAPVYTAPPVLTNPNVDYVTGTTLLPITLRAYDQYGSLYTGSVPPATVSSLTLPVTVTGTLTRPFVAGVATFDDLVPTGSITPPVTPPTITSVTPILGPVGTSVTISVNTDAPLTSVSFNGHLATSLTRVDGGTVIALVPSGASSGPITVVANNGTAVWGLDFFVTPVTPPVTPTVTTIVREVPAYTNPSVIRIANLALQRVGATKLIASLDEPSKEARTVRQSWDHLRDLVLAEYPWGFATKYAALPLLDLTRKPWQFVYRLPADCLFPLGLEVQAHVSQLQDLIPFECQADESGPVLVTDMPDAVLRYSAQLIDPLDWPIWFHELMAWRLASELAMPLTVQPAMKQSVDAGLAQARVQAAQRAAMAQQSPNQPTPSAFVLERGASAPTPFR